MVTPAMSPAQAPEIVRQLDRGIELAVEAQKTEGERPQAEKFKAAINAFEKVTKKDPKSAEGAEALLYTAKIRAGVPIDSKPGNELNPKFDTDAQNLGTARENFRLLVQRFNGKRSYESLVNEYGNDEAGRIKAAVDEAEAYHELAGLETDKRNRGKMLYRVMDALVAVTGRVPWLSYWVAIVLLTVIVKILITPLTKAQFKSMREMQRLQPLIKQLQEKYKGDQREIGAKTMELYKEHGVNPLAGCLPILIQMPILILVYTAIRYYEFQFAKGTFLWIGWDQLVHNFSIPIMGRPVWITAANLAQPDLILLVLYTVSMVVSQRLSAVDPTQAEQQKMMAIMMPLMFFFLIGYLPSAFVLYWLIFNLLQTWQQYHIIHGVQPAEILTAGPEPSATSSSRRASRRRRRR